MQEKHKLPWKRQPTLFIRAEGGRYKTKDWSLARFSLEHFHRALLPRDHIVGQIRVSRFGRSGDFKAEVVGIPQGPTVSLRILEISPSVLEAMTSVRYASR